MDQSQSDTLITPHSSDSGDPFTEFFVFMLPCFFFIGVAFKKLNDLSNQTHLGQINKQNSFHFKKIFSLVHVFVFIAQLIFASVVTKEVYWVAEYRAAALVYLLGIAAWIISVRLLDKEAERGLPQVFIEHRVLWIASFVITIIKILTPIEQQAIPLILNLLKIVASAVLALYALAKPYDSDEAEEANGRGSNPLPFVRKLLIKIEDAPCTESILGNKDYDKTAPLLFSKGSSDHEDFADDFKAFMKKNNIKQATPAQAGDWLKSLPIVSCNISRDVVAKQEGAGQIKVFYEVKTKVDDETYTKLHKYGDFSDLEDSIKKRCDPSKVSYIDRAPPGFEKVEVSNFPDEKSFVNARIDILERYLNTLSSDPRFMNDTVLDFLGILDPHRSAFLKYIAYLATNSKKKPQRMDKTPGAIELGPMTTSQQKKREIESQIPTLKVRCSHAQKSIHGDMYEYIFVVFDEKDGSSWSLTKSYGDFKTFHDNLERAVEKSIPYLNQYVPKPINQKQTMDPPFVEKRKQGLNSYINMILQQPAYHTTVLYDFLEYDAKRGIHSSRHGSIAVPSNRRE